MPSTAFIEFLLENHALKFGTFTLKSGRISPYFFNLGVFNSGKSLEILGTFYAKTLLDAGFDYEVLFGPAYKGIPLVATTSIALFNHHRIDASYCFNRKEAKNHGDGGTLVGAPLQGNVIMFDDVITAGTTVKETLQLMDQHDATLNGIVIAFDREERGTGTLSAVQEITEKTGVQIQSILKLSDVLTYLQDKPAYAETFEAIQAYQAEWGCQ